MMKFLKKVLYLSVLSCVLLISVAARAGRIEDSTRISKANEALVYLSGVKKLERSKFWPNVDPDQLLSNLKTFTVEPFSFYEGKTTNFCAYSALTYIPLYYDPLGFSKFMVQLYKYGEAIMDKTVIKPSRKVREEAGLLKYKGALDINPAGQMWFLSLADHFKGYLNFFNRRFDKGDENTFWASTNFAKFNRMLRRLFPGRVTAIGADLIRPSVDIYEYTKRKSQKGVVFVYLNNKKLYRKTHTRGIINTPTHYVLLTDINKLPNGDIEFVYWDYGLRTLQQMPPNFFKKIVYGVTTYYPGPKK